MIKTRLALPVLAAAAAIAGCGGGSSSSSEIAGLAPPDSLVFVEGKLRPTGSLKANVDSIASKVAGVDSLGSLIVEELEKSAREDGEPFDYEKEVAPWLGEEAGIAFKSFEHGDTSEPLVLVETSSGAAARKFVEKQTEESKVPYKDGSYEGVDFKVGGKEGNAIGVLGEFLVVANDEALFKEAVDASNGESLADESRFSDAISAATDGSLADAYVDVGGLIEHSHSTIQPQLLQALKTSGLDPSEATAVVSLVPGADQVELDVSADVGGEVPPAGDASKTLGSLPGDAFVALASTGFGERLQEALDELDKNGIPGRLPPNQLKKGASGLGFDLDKIAASLQDAGLFASGTASEDLGGALVLTTNDSSEIVTAIRTIGLLVRQSGTPGVTALSGKVNGFSVRSPKLGPKPLVVATKGDRVAIGYGLQKTLFALGVGNGPMLSETTEYKEAADALGDTPISGFIDGGRALALAETLVPASDRGFHQAAPYLGHIRYIAIGSGSEGDRATAKLIAGIEK
jgi:hypothetical protein